VFRIAVLSFWHVHAKDYALETKEHPGTEITAVWDEDRERGQTHKVLASWTIQTMLRSEVVP
jgi:hypothetical protein